MSGPKSEFFVLLLKSWLNAQKTMISTSLKPTEEFIPVYNNVIDGFEHFECALSDLQGLLDEDKVSEFLTKLNAKKT